jgi:thiol-disulfide isomerase/thioredoxin
MSERTVPPTLGQAVEDYYTASPLPQVKLRRLIKRPRGQRFWILSGALATAAALVLLVFTFGYNGRLAGSNTTPNLVAVQIHADWCARSPEVAPIFTDLLTEYGNEPVLFVTFDITDDVRRGQAELLAESLGIPQAFDPPFESGMIKLIDRRNETVLASITGRDESAQFELLLAEFLQPRP